jgi:phage tail sheath protein FI
MPTEIDYPGVYVQEREGGGRTIEGVSTSVAAFVGYTIEGPLNEPVRVTGSADFERAFGAIDATSDLSYAIAHFFQNGGSDAWVIRVVGAADLARPTPAELIGSQADRTGIYALDAVDLLNLLVIPNQADSELQAAMIDYAKARRAFAILDLPDTVDTLPEARAWITDFDTSKGLNAAAYFPRIVASDPAQSGQRRSFANSGAIAGIYARTDAQRGVWKAPAGTDASISGVEDLDCHLTQNELGTINTLGSE